MKTAVSPLPLYESFDIPDDLRSVPGIVRDRAEEKHFASVFPEPDFDHTPPGKAHKHLAPAMSEAYQRMQARFSDRVKEQLNKAIGYYQLPPIGEPTGEDITEAVRNAATKIGIQIVGFTRFTRDHVYSNYKRQVRFKNMIIAGVEESPDWSDLIPGEESLNTIVATRLRAADLALELADFIRRRGYKVQFLTGPLGLELVKVLPYALEAGMGQMGANGQLLSPYFGSRWKPISMSTDAPVTYDEPRDFGINVICDKCQVCVNRCPGRALPNRRVTWRGVRKYKTQPERCIPMLERYDACAICVKVCPIQRYGLNAVLDHYRETGEIKGKGTEELEGYTLPDKGHFGPGELPKFKPEERRIRYELVAELEKENKALFGLDWSSSSQGHGDES